MASWDLHVVVAAAAVEDLAAVLRRHHAERFAELVATPAERAAIFEVLRGHDGDTIRQHWRAFCVEPLDDGWAAIWFAFRVDHPDDYFGDDVAALSRLLDGELCYVWERHLDHGYEVFCAGARVNSVVLSTHAPLVTIDGQQRTRARGDEDPVEQHSAVPRTIRERVKQPSAAPGEWLLFLGQGLASLDELLAIVRGERRRRERGCWTTLILGLLLLATLVGTCVWTCG